MRSPSDGGSYLTKNHDRHAIVAHSAPNLEPRHRGINARVFSNSIGWQRLSLTTIVAHDRGSIVAGSPHDQGQFSAKLGMIRRGIEATRPPSEPLPRPLQIASTTASIAHDFGLIFPLKSHVFSLCSSTFDRFVKKLSKFQGRSLVHRDPPAFRLNCEAIGAGLITNFSLISSNFPFEFRTSMTKNPSKFASIHEN